MKVGDRARVTVGVFSGRHGIIRFVYPEGDVQILLDDDTWWSNLPASVVESIDDRRHIVNAVLAAFESAGLNHGKPTVEHQMDVANAVADLLRVPR